MKYITEAEKLRRDQLSKNVKKLFDTESVYYVYEHIDPRTREVRYVGHGVDGRAYEFVKPSARRHIEHAEWAMELFSMDYTPADIVRLRAFGVSKKSAKRIETDILRKMSEKGKKAQLFNRAFPKDC